MFAGYSQVLPAHFDWLVAMWRSLQEIPLWVLQHAALIVG